MKQSLHNQVNLFFHPVQSPPPKKRMVKTISICAIKANHSTILMIEFI